jgi:hypothetical protein
MRRMRRRNTVRQFYCQTNGCTSFLELDAGAGVAICPICGYRRRVN